MLAVVFDDKVEVREVPDPIPGEGEALVKVLLAGICGTDIGLLAGYKSFRGIPGHEMVGVVEEAPDPSWVGARVVSEINIACGSCPLCRQGLARHCETRQVLGLVDKAGVFSERVAVPLENLHRVPDSIPDEEAVWTEPLAAALAVGEVGIRRGDQALVVGDGRLGALIVLGLQYCGAEVELVGKSSEKLQRLEALGVRVRREPPSPVYPFVIEATGSPLGLEAARAWTRPRGTIVLKSTCHEPSKVDVSRVVVDELRLVGSRCGDFPPALEALASGALPVRHLISRTYPLAKAEGALAEAVQPGVFKVLLDMRGLNR
jgi:threonine dehydrogenase-like Zn-dependent dehydrogenase